MTFTSLLQIDGPLQWKIIYVGSASNESHDQILEEFEIGPFEEPSTMKFEIECEAPDAKKIPAEELLCTFILILGVTAIILTVSYKG